MDAAIKEQLEEIIAGLKEAIGLDEETIERIERVTHAQQEVGKVIMDLEPNEAAQVVVGAMASVCVSYADNLQQALSLLAKMQSAALNIIEGADKNELAPWNEKDDDDDEEETDDFPVDHKTKQ